MANPIKGNGKVSTSNRGDCKIGVEKQWGVKAGAAEKRGDEPGPEP